MTKFKILFTVLIITCAVSLTSAQGEPPPPGDRDRIDSPQRGERLADLLGLSQEQRVQVRQLNRQQRPQMRQAQENVKNAKDVLDKAIYADEVDELTLQTKVRAVIEAQAEVLKIRTSTEFAIRNVLTPVQLVKFRDIRNKAKQRRQRIQQRNRRINPNRRNNNRRKPPPRRGNRP